jgi:hypothetical protein
VSPGTFGQERKWLPAWRLASEAPDDAVFLARAKDDFDRAELMTRFPNLPFCKE